jgi:hypothetical protein
MVDGAQGVVYITDSTSRHEITSWRAEEADEPEPLPAGLAPVGSYSAHMVLLVDCSGSMRKNDVGGFDSRTDAVYKTIARDLVRPQVRLATPSWYVQTGPRYNSTRCRSSIIAMHSIVSGGTVMRPRVRAPVPAG